MGAGAGAALLGIGAPGPREGGARLTTVAGGATGPVAAAAAVSTAGVGLGLGEPREARSAPRSTASVTDDTPFVNDPSMMDGPSCSHDMGTGASMDASLSTSSSLALLLSPLLFYYGMRILSPSPPSHRPARHHPILCPRPWCVLAGMMISDHLLAPYQPASHSHYSDQPVGGPLPPIQGSLGDASSEHRSFEPLSNSFNPITLTADLSVHI